MDIYCRYCGEPWDHDELHEMESHTGEAISYLKAAERFKALGCNAFSPDTGRLREIAGLSSKPKHCTVAPILPDEMLRYIAELQDISPYPEEWPSPDDSGCMLEIVEEMF